MSAMISKRQNISSSWQWHAMTFYRTQSALYSILPSIDWSQTSEIFNRIRYSACVGNKEKKNHKLFHFKRDKLLINFSTRQSFTIETENVQTPKTEQRKSVIFILMFNISVKRNLLNAISSLSLSHRAPMSIGNFLFFLFAIVVTFPCLVKFTYSTCRSNRNRLVSKQLTKFLFVILPPSCCCACILPFNVVINSKMKRTNSKTID